MNQRSKPRIAIVMKREELIAFFRMEAELCGYDAEICATAPRNPSHYDLILIDPEVGYCVSDTSSCFVIAMVEGNTKKSLSWAHCVWEWPISLETVHRTLEQVKAQQAADTLGQEENPPIRSGSDLYLISREEGKILYHNQTLTLTPSEMTILCFLSDDWGQTVSEEELRARIGGGQGNQVAVHICHLRKRLEEVSPHRLIETRRGKGYVLRVPLKPME